MLRVYVNSEHSDQKKGRVEEREEWGRVGRVGKSGKSRVDLGWSGLVWPRCLVGILFLALW